MWSGSEELWSMSAKHFLEQGYKIAFATKFNHSELNTLKGDRKIFSDRFPLKPLWQRAMERIPGIHFKQKDILLNFIKRVNPKLVVISQGNNVNSFDLMLSLKEYAIPYVTLTQLVAEVHFLTFDNTNHDKFRQAYLGALKNYFVSQNNLNLNNLMLGLELPNAEVVYNPCKVNDNDISIYPSVIDLYKFGLVGRIECLHKGYDLLLQVLNNERWRARPVQFNLYGSGPHTEMIKANIKNLNLTNIELKGYSNEVGEIWRDNHILLMPSRMEGQSLALIEAMYCQRAAVVTNVGGAIELIKDGYNGFIAEAPSVQALDAALECAWVSRDSWKEMGQNAAKTLTEQYPEDAVAYFNHKVLKLLN